VQLVETNADTNIVRKEQTQRKYGRENNTTPLAPKQPTSSKTSNTEANTDSRKHVSSPGKGM
jgi:hypothetical protein